jgi:hypothetical protein
MWKSALDRSRLSNYSWMEKKPKKPETASPARKVSQLNSFSPDTISGQGSVTDLLQYLMSGQSGACFGQILGQMLMLSLF